MSLFVTRRPRGFHHQYLYVDERKERLKEMERNARRNLGIDVSPTVEVKENIERTFRTSLYHRNRKKRNLQSIVIVMAFFIAVFVTLVSWALLSI